jgi:tetratricopeptide (TPR) repeat protein
MLDRAVRLGPANPRALLISGQSALNTPPEYGGSAARAEGLFRAALKGFDAQPANAPWQNWGRFDAHAWLGQALAARGDKAGARAEYEKALAIAPDSGWVRFSLLPAVK